MENLISVSFLKIGKKNKEFFFLRGLTFHSKDTFASMVIILLGSQTGN